MNDMRSAFEKAGFQGMQGKQNHGKPPVEQQNRPALQKRQTYQSNQSLRQEKSVELGQGYVNKAETVILEFKEQNTKSFKNLTTSKIRNILSQVTEIYNEVQNDSRETLNPGIQERIEYLKVRLVYECGREPYVIKPFVEKAGLLSLIDNIRDSRKKFIDFARYMEALVAYHRFHGGEDK